MGKILSGKTFFVYFIFGATPVFTGRLLASYFFGGLFLWIKSRYCAVIAVTFNYYSVSKHDMDDYNMEGVSEGISERISQRW